MFFWRGKGVLVIVVAFGSSLVANLLADHFGGPGYWDRHGWPMAAAFGVAAMLLWSIDSLFLDTPPRILTDQNTGERVTLVARNDFFFISIRSWSLILAGLGLLILVTRWSPGH
ncbi:MAG TPA: hypothetical protein VNY97_01915 [Candidatus Angelobacter sp.]|nr:hypothetical protein [Candidatus Angelobacter sp.]